MTMIVRLPLESTVPDLWEGVAARVLAWAAAREVTLRDAVVLLPFAQLLPLARAAFARDGGWMPRIETTRTLAAGLGPPPAVPAGQISFDPTLDALSAAALLRSQPWGAAWARRDARGFEQATETLVATAHELVRGAATVAPPLRDAHWAQARAALAPAAGPGSAERLLARVALEWAALAPAPATDRLYALTPSAWIAVEAGGADPLVNALLASAEVRTLRLVTDPPDDDPQGAPPRDAPAYALCDSFEHEAQCAAAQVLLHVQRGQTPVALVAQDRVLVRRVRALLDRHALRLLDETGWKLSTTRAAALLMGLLRAARADAGTDALLDWLKAAGEDATALDALEEACRKGQIRRVAELPAAVLKPPADRLWAAAAAVLGGLSTPGRQPLAAWLAALERALQACGALRNLQDDDAGRQVLGELRLAQALPANGAWAAGASQASMNAAEFRQWVDSVLERATFRPAAPFDGLPDVVITPLAQALLRPFAAVVLPGADDRHLGHPVKTPSLLSDAQAAAIGLPAAAERRRRERLAFDQLLAMPRVTLLRRRLEGAEPLADSALVAQLSLRLAQANRDWRPWVDPREEVQLAATPIAMPAPPAPQLLPRQLSASACEALRACPYRFYALYALHLREDDELEREVEKRDYGDWLHAVLHEFHRGRVAPDTPEAERSRLTAIARARQATQGLRDADFLPYAASFETFAPRYIEWLHERDAEGARWRSGEEKITLADAALGGTELRGIIDRIDEHGSGAAMTLELIDYKTGSASKLVEKVRQPFEDTQLGFYAALVRAQTDLPLSAQYLALDATKGLESIWHKEVEASAAALLEGLAHDLRRLRAGHGLPALGEGATCDYCAARGICRRDHWSGT